MYSLYKNNKKKKKNDKDVAPKIGVPLIVILHHLC